MVEKKFCRHVNYTKFRDDFYIRKEIRPENGVRANALAMNAGQTIWRTMGVWCSLFAKKPKFLFFVFSHVKDPVKCTR